MKKIIYWFLAQCIRLVRYILREIALVPQSFKDQVLFFPEFARMILHKLRFILIILSAIIWLPVIFLKRDYYYIPRHIRFASWKFIPNPSMKNQWQRFGDSIEWLCKLSFANANMACFFQFLASRMSDQFILDNYFVLFFACGLLSVMFALFGKNLYRFGVLLLDKWMRKNDDDNDPNDNFSFFKKPFVPNYHRN